MSFPSSFGYKSQRLARASPRVRYYSVSRPPFFSSTGADSMETPKETMSSVCPDGSTGRLTPTEEPPTCQQARRASLYSAIRSHMLESVRPSGLTELELLLLTV